MIAHVSLAGHLASAVVTVAVFAVYAACWARAGARRTGRLVSWTAGLAAASVLSAPRVEAAASGSFTAHMVQHLGIVLVVAPLLAAARPVATVTAALRAQLRPADRVAHTIGRSVRPDVVAFATPLLATAFLGLVHLTGWYDAALRSVWVHELEHLGFLLVGTLLWSGVVGRHRPATPVRAVGAFGTLAGTSLVALVLLGASEALSAVHTAELGSDALADQRAGVTLMWVSGMVVVVPMVVGSLWRWAGREQRAAEHRERAAANAPT